MPSSVSIKTKITKRSTAILLATTEGLNKTDNEAILKWDILPTHRYLSTGQEAYIDKGKHEIVAPLPSLVTTEGV